MSLNGNPMKILIVSQIFYPTKNKDYGIKEAILDLAEKGNKICVISSKSSEDADFNHENVTMHYINQDKFIGSGEWAYVFHNISFMLKAIQMGPGLTNDFDKVVAVVPTCFAAIAGKMLAKKSPKAEFCLDVKEPWVESAVASGYIKNGSPIFKAAKIVENYILNGTPRYSLGG